MKTKFFVFALVILALVGTSACASYAGEDSPTSPSVVVLGSPLQVTFQRVATSCSSSFPSTCAASPLASVSGNGASADVKLQETSPGVWTGEFPALPATGRYQTVVNDPWLCPSTGICGSAGTTGVGISINGVKLVDVKNGWTSFGYAPPNTIVK